MPVPVFSAADYAAAMQALMPRGRVWPRDSGALQSKVIAGLAASYATQHARSGQLLVDAFPTTTNELLPEWEATLGLPSPSAGAAQSVAARSLLVAARFVGLGGVSIANIKSFAELLGYPAITVVSSSPPFRCGISSAGKPVGGTERMFSIEITAPGGMHAVFGIYGTAVLQSELQRVLPAHVYPIFKFT